MQPLPGLHCGVTEGEMVECNSDNLIKYLNSVLTAKDIAELVAKMVGESIAGDKDLYVVATETAVDATKLMIQLKKDEIVEDLVKKVIKTMMDAAVQQVAAFAQATSLPPRMAEVRAHEAYVQAIQSEAISESIKYVDTSVDSQNYSHSNLSINTSGPAFHQLSYSAIHGAGWW
jgi:uncharacterized protein (UPF0297 family)